MMIIYQKLQKKSDISGDNAQERVKNLISHINKNKNLDFISIEDRQLLQNRMFLHCRNLAIAETMQKAGYEYMAVGTREWARGKQDEQINFAGKNNMLWDIHGNTKEFKLDEWLALELDNCKDIENMDELKREIEIIKSSIKDHPNEKQKNVALHIINQHEILWGLKNPEKNISEPVDVRIHKYETQKQMESASILVKCKNLLEIEKKRSSEWVQGKGQEILNSRKNAFLSQDETKKCFFTIYNDGTKAFSKFQDIAQIQGHEKALSVLSEKTDSLGEIKGNFFTRTFSLKKNIENASSCASEMFKKFEITSQLDSQFKEGLDYTRKISERIKNIEHIFHERNYTDNLIENAEIHGSIHSKHIDLNMAEEIADSFDLTHKKLSPLESQQKSEKDDFQYDSIKKEIFSMIYFKNQDFYKS